MAYCKNCGAYIPDGLSACLACGFDENLKAEEGTAAAAQSKNDELRRKLEEQRKVQQEANRRWAEQEQARRQQQEESRRWAEEEFARRQADKQQQEQAAARGTAYRSVVRDLGSAVRDAAGNVARDAGSVVRDSTGESNKLFAGLSYISFLFVLPYILCPQDGFAKFHAKQGLKLFIFSIIADALGALTGFGWIFTLLRLYLIYKGMTNAFNGREEPLPYIGNIGG